jgi:tetratricopeptide (TPR) repeat protein
MTSAQAPRRSCDPPQRRSATRRALGAWALVLLSTAALAAAETLTPQRQRAILRDALDAYDRAVEVSRADPSEAAALYREAAGGFHALLGGGVRNAALEYNLGNVYFRLGRLGRAILHYRRAETLAPGDARLAANLRYARNRVEPVILPGGEKRLARQLFFWHYRTSLRQRATGLMLFAAAGWTLLLAWLRWRRSGILAFGLACVALSMAAGASIRWQLADEAATPHAVLVESAAYLRRGRSETADPALKQPLGPGVELRILETRGAWVEVRLLNGQTGWLPEEAVERV